MRTQTAAAYLRETRKTPTRDDEVRQRVRRILDAVRENGDDAVAEYTEALDGVRPRRIRVDRSGLRRAWEKTDGDVKAALEEAARNLREFQSKTKPEGQRVETRPGVTVRLDWRPLGSVMCYAPGGRAAYPSTVLMTAVPAAVAGVEHVYVASPPQPNGRPSDLVLAAAHLAGAQAVFAVGGAQAVAAFAYGTETIPKVDKIVGPGNAYVAEAKRQVVGDVGIDALAGPSELALVAEADTDPALVAIDLAAQAEHDPQARAILVAPTAAYAERVSQEIDKVAAASDRQAILAESLQKQGLAVVAKDFATQVRVLDAAAPEHVQLMVRHPGRYTRALRWAGTIFEGIDSPAPLGDYVTGADHVLPTGGTARWSGPLGVYDFLKPLVVQRVTPEGIKTVGPHAVVLAEAEGLPAHAESVRRRL